jgi:hypothetical protein
LTLHDLNILRVLQLFDNCDVSTQTSGTVFEIVNGEDLKWCARLHVIIMTVLLIVIGLFPVLVRTWLALSCLWVTGDLDTEVYDVGQKLEVAAGVSKVEFYVELHGFLKPLLRSP